jgi:hypothetical protein
VVGAVYSATHSHEEAFKFDSNETVLHILSCKDEDKGNSCAIIKDDSSKGAMLFALAFDKAYLEVEVFKGNARYPMKVMVEHGTEGGKPKTVPAGYKLISCFCHQTECIYQSPHNSQGLSTSIYGDLVLTVEK